MTRPIQFIASENPREMYMIELQGSVSGASFDGNMLGSLSFNEKGHPELAIGSRVLEGKSEKLKVPLLATQPCENGGNFEILGVVKQRLLFSSRPRIDVVSDVATNQSKFRS